MYKATFGLETQGVRTLPCKVIVITDRISNGCIITILVFRKKKPCLMSITTNSQCIFVDFAKMPTMVMGKRDQWLSCNHLYYVFKYLGKADYAINKFIHLSIFRYNKIYEYMNMKKYKISLIFNNILLEKKYSSLLTCHRSLLTTHMLASLMLIGNLLGCTHGWLVCRVGGDCA